LSIVRAQPERVAELATLARDDDWLVSMRALDVLEKIAHDHPDWIHPHKKVLIGGLAESDKWEIRLQIVRALPLARWTARERARVVDILRNNLVHPQKFVRAWALDSLATMAVGDSGLRRTVARALDEFEASGSRALQSRARHIRLRLASPASRGSATRRAYGSAQVGRSRRPADKGDGG
jgi:hypothetical protein